MKDLHKSKPKPLSKPKYNLRNSEYRYEYPAEPKPRQEKSIFTFHLLFGIFFVSAGFMFYLTHLTQSIISSGATRDGVYIFFAGFVALIFAGFIKILMQEKGGQK